VSIKRLTPTIKDLGSLRLWQDEVDEIVTFVRQQLGNETIVLEADGNELDDVVADLPKLGRRVRYFTIKVTGKPDAENEPPRELLTITLRRSRCKIEATNPDVTTRGVISDIQDVAQRCRRLPLWYPQMGIFSSESPSILQIAPSSQASGVQIFTILLFAFSAAGTFIGALALPGELTVGSNDHKVSVGVSLAVLIPSAVIFIATIIGDALSRTIIFTGTRQGAPTFWQRNRAGIIINVVVAAAFFLLGLLIGG
jgi:hypothetical protein